MWLAKIDLLAVSALITAVGGVSLPFLLPIATRRVKLLEEQVEDLERRVDECEERELRRSRRRH